MIDPGLVEALARLPDEERKEAARRAQAARKRLVRDVVQRVRATVLPMLNDSAAARAIADVAHGRGPQSVTLLRSAVESRLLEELGGLDDLPEWERVRQLLRE